MWNLKCLFYEQFPLQKFSPPLKLISADHNDDCRNFFSSSSSSFFLSTEESWIVARYKNKEIPRCDIFVMMPNIKICVMDNYYTDDDFFANSSKVF